MFSIFPVPQLPWEERKARWLLAAFPFTGFAMGWILYGLFSLFALWGTGRVLQAVTAVFLLAFLSGFIHLDGFADATDAIFSRRGREEELRIMKDPHCGTMAIVGLIAFFAFEIALFYELAGLADIRRLLIALPFILSLERCFSASLLILLPRTKSSAMGAMIADPAPRPLPLILFGEALIFSLTPLLFFPASCLIPPALLALAALSFGYFAKKRYGGMNGDLCGFFLCTEEVLALFLLLHLAS